MKAILVIDVPTLVDGRHLCNECPIWNGKQFYCQYDFNTKAKGCPLKLMPTKKKPLFDPNHCEIEEEIKIVHEIVGYNRCVDEIMGETE